MAIYVGVNGVAKKVKQAYIGVDGTAVPIYTSSTLPSDYAPVEYVTSISQLDTKLYAGPYTRVCLYFKFFPSTRSVTLLGGVGGYSIFKDTTNIFYVQWPNEFTSSSIVSSTNKYLLDVVYDTNRRTAFKKFDANSWTVLGTHSGASSYNNTSLRFTYGSNTGENYFIYYCKIIGDIYNPTDSTTREFFPVHQKSTGKNGLYDIINNKFYTTDTIEAGPNIQNYNIPSFAH